jgi:hypothetical protein
LEENEAAREAEFAYLANMKKEEVLFSTKSPLLTNSYAEMKKKPDFLEKATPFQNECGFSALLKLRFPIQPASITVAPKDKRPVQAEQQRDPCEVADFAGWLNSMLPQTFCTWCTSISLFFSTIYSKAHLISDILPAANIQISGIFRRKKRCASL